MKILDILINELNMDLTEEEKRNGCWERKHSEQYEIVDTENGRFHNKTTNQ